MAEISQKAPQSLYLVRSRRSNRGTSSDVFSDLTQSRVKVLGGRSVELQRNVVRHSTEVTLLPLTMLATLK
jgi:hypothetical protein